ncbi:MAG: hypothetical protein E5V93_16660 [Mesorhizobium sp.]|nr:MAG: hypothetical protein E5V93_16660 [Mesorhizobium sp.]
MAEERDGGFAPGEAIQPLLLLLAVLPDCDHHSRLTFEATLSEETSDQREVTIRADIVRQRHLMGPIAVDN